MGDLLIGAGLVAGILAGGLLLARGVATANRTAATLAALLLVAAVSGGLIVLSWRAPDSAQGSLQVAEFLLLMAVGPLSAIIVASLLRIEIPSQKLCAMAAVSAVAALLVTWRHGGDPIVYAVPVQCLYLVYSWGLWFRSRRIRDRRHRAHKQRSLTLALLSALSLVSASSITRTLFPHVELFRQLVPLTISLLFLLLLASALAMLVWRGAGLLAPAPACGQSDQRLAGRAADLLRSEELYRRPDLQAEDLASALEVSGTELHVALAHSEWGGFAALLQAVRLERVAAMLCSPAERQTSVEAIGMLCGYRSRSSLYEAFQRDFRMSPGEYRRKTCPES